MEIEKMNYTHFIHRFHGTIVLVDSANEKEMKKYIRDENYYQYFMLQK